MPAVVHSITCCYRLHHQCRERFVAGEFPVEIFSSFSSPLLPAAPYPGEGYRGRRGRHRERREGRETEGGEGKEGMNRRGSRKVVCVCVCVWGGGGSLGMRLLLHTCMFTNDSPSWDSMTSC